MVRAALVVLFCLLSACSAGKPSDGLIARIEQQLSQDQCLSGIKGLRRTYQFAKRDGRDLVDIEIQEAGHNGLPAGRFAIKPETTITLDDSQFFGARATYVISTGELDIWHCGMNFGGMRHEPRF